MVQHIHSVDLVLDGKTGEGGEYMYLSLVNGINSTFYIVKDQYELLVQTNRSNFTRHHLITHTNIMYPKVMIEKIC